MGKFDLQIDGKLKSLTAGDASWYYGGDGIAWPDLATARINVPDAIRPNQTVGVLVKGKVIEYKWHPNDISDEGLVLKNPTEEVIIEKDVFDTLELAMIKPLANNKSFVIEKEEGFNGFYKYDSTKEKGYSLIFSFVSNVSVQGIDAIGRYKNIDIDETIQLEVAISPENATNKKLHYHSGFSNVATVSSTGEVLGVSEGETTITVDSDDGGFGTTFNISVSAVEPVRTEINGGDSTSESDGIINGGNSTSESDGIINGGDSTNTSD